MLLGFVVLFVMLASGAGNGFTSHRISASYAGSDAEKAIKESVSLSTPKLVENDRYSYLLMDGISHYTKEAGAPLMPVIIKTYTFPAGSRITRVECHPSGIEMMKVDKKILPSMGAIPLGSSMKNLVRKEDERIYSSSQPYPENWFRYNIGVGLYNGNHVIFLTVEIHPVRYYPAEDMIEYARNMRIEVEYETGSMNFGDGYDLMIIAPSSFSDYVQPLIEHKENHGVATMMLTTEEIYSKYNGRDEQEKIKYAIKDAVEEYGIKYVLFVGAMKGQRLHKWYVPVRYTHLDDNSSWETGYISDLYYADLYKYEDGNVVFDDWDSNGNGKFAEWDAYHKDVLDLYPDVYVGRLACRYPWEVKTMVDKIITYENNAGNSNWFRRMVVIGGDSFPDQDIGTDYIEGQVECDQALSYMDGFEHVRVYVEGGDVEFTPENAEEEISQGEGFVYFSGHGNPASWATHPHNDFNTWIDFSLKNIMNLDNGEKLPVLIVGGCHNSQFNTSILRLLTEGIWAYWLGEATPECWGWIFTRNPNGGSIATMGNTGLGYGTVGDGPVDEVPDSQPDGIPDCIQYLGGWLEPHFFEVYNKQGKDILGETWGTNLIDYLNEFPIDWNSDWIGVRPYTINLVNCKTVQEWVLFGDPSLKIGGY